MASTPPNIKFVYHTIIFIFFVALSLKLFTWLLFLTIISNIAMNVLAQTTLWGSMIISLAEFLEVE